MSNLPLVSVVIPTFNRAHLLLETIESIFNQSYENWECWVVDDGSTDNSEEVMNSLTDEDERVRYLHRPSSKEKGANSCRNIGLEHAKGAYIIFFDSDDLMKPDHIKVKVDAILQYQCDFVITRTEYFNHTQNNDSLAKHYQFTSDDISAYNYINHKVNWLTLDVCIESNLAKSIAFNEQLKSGQEYNYFSKLILKSDNAIYVDKIVSLRRAHESSIQGDLRRDKEKLAMGFFTVYWLTYNDVVGFAAKRIRQILIFKCYKTAIKNRHVVIEKGEILRRPLIKEFGFKGVYYSISLLKKKFNL